MKTITKGVASALLAMASFAAMASTFVPKGTHVTLIFDQYVSSHSAKVGDRFHMHVANNVYVGNRIVLPAGTPVIGVISGVRGRAHFGVNGSLHVTMEPVRGIELVPRTQGKMVGSRADQAALAAGAGAIVLGPVGLLGGYFAVGKNVELKPGQTMETEVSKDTWIP